MSGFSSQTLLFSQCSCIPESSYYLRTRKHVPCLCRVIETRVEVWENGKCYLSIAQVVKFVPSINETQIIAAIFINLVETADKMLQIFSIVKE